MPHPQYDDSDSLCLTQYENSDGVSDFPPIRKCDSTPDPPTQFHSKRHSSPSQSPRLPRSRMNKKGLGDKNILNMVRVSAQQAKVRLQGLRLLYWRMIVRMSPAHQESEDRNPMILLISDLRKSAASLTKTTRIGSSVRYMMSGTVWCKLQITLETMWIRSWMRFCVKSAYYLESNGLPQFFLCRQSS